MTTEEALELMRWKVRVQNEESKEERKNRIENTCKKCIHWTGNCNYILDMGHQRPCPSTMFREMGVFKEGKRASNGKTVF